MAIPDPELVELTRFHAAADPASMWPGVLVLELCEEIIRLRALLARTDAYLAQQPHEKKI